jgi:hypothetical protein
VYEKRIIYRVVEELQFMLKDKKLNIDYSDDITEGCDVSFTTASLLPKGSENNYTRITDSFKKLTSRTFTAQIGKELIIFPFFYRSKKGQRSL